MNQETTLIGKWQFIGAERYNGSKWQSATYVEGMAWEFFPQYFSESRTIGNIVETTPTNTPIEMAYLYTPKERLLKIEIFTDCTIGSDDKSEADFYDVIFTDVEPNDTPILFLSILTQEGAPLPYLRYVLQKV